MLEELSIKLKILLDEIKFGSDIGIHRLEIAKV